MTGLERITEFKLPMGVLAADIHADKTQIVCGCMDGVYRANISDKSFERITQHESYVSSVALVDESTVLSAGYDGAVQWSGLSAGHLHTEKLHSFWSWDMAISPDKKTAASVTGQYLAGGYRYEPAPEREPSVVVFSVGTREVLFQLPHVPSVQAVALSPDGRFVAAGNIMGEIRVWDVQSGMQAATWTTSEFTSWGIIKSHCYLGGVFALEFTPDGEELLLAGMGQMRDPMAGNGKQLWQKWKWNQSEPKMTDQTHKGENGEGLMETLAIHPSGEFFVMGGRLRGGSWNLAAFELASGKRTATLKTGYRITEARFFDEGRQLLVVGTQGQPGPKKDGAFSSFGRVEVYKVI